MHMRQSQCNSLPDSRPVYHANPHTLPSPSHPPQYSTNPHILEHHKPSLPLVSSWASRKLRIMAVGSSWAELRLDILNDMEAFLLFCGPRTCVLTAAHHAGITTLCVQHAQVHGGAVLDGAWRFGGRCIGPAATKANQRRRLHSIFGGNEPVVHTPYVPHHSLRTTPPLHTHMTQGVSGSVVGAAEWEIGALEAC